MSDKEKSKIIIEITKVVYECKKTRNEKLNSIIVYNQWSNNSNLKVNDINFIAELLNYIDDIILIDNSLLKEIVDTEKE